MLPLKYEWIFTPYLLALSLCIFLLFPANTFANSYNQYSVPPSKNYSVNNGLAQVSVYDIAQDNDGFIWLATQKGADRFDGYDFVNFGQSEESAKGLSSDLVYEVEVDSTTGDIWFGTLNGLNVLRYSSKQFELVSLSLDEGKRILSVFVDGKGNVFVGTQNGFYAKMAGSDSFSLISSSDKPLVVQDISAYGNHSVMVATSVGLYRYHKASSDWRLFALAGVSLETVLVDSNEQLWLGTIGRGLFKADLAQEEVTNLVNLSVKDGFTDSLINDIHEMPDGAIWVATTNGLSIFPDGKSLAFLTYFKRDSNAKDSLNSHLLSLHSISSGLIFFGTNANGFSVVDPNKKMFNRYVVGENQHHYHIAAEPDDTLWIAAETGVWKRLPNNELVGPFLTAQGDQTVNKVMSMSYDPKTDTLWAATRLGLGKISSGSDYIEYVALLNKEIYSIAIADSGIWVGSTSHGLHFYDFAKESITQSFDTSMVIAIHVQNETELIVATANGLLLINPESSSMKTITKDTPLTKPLTHNVITWVSEYEKGKYFIGLHSHGLMLMTLDSFDAEPQFSQLFDDTILSTASIGAVVVDNSKKLWVSTERGIAKGNLQNNKLSYFDETDGTNESGYYIGSHAILSDSSIHFAGDQGITYFYPQNISKNVVMPPLKVIQARSLRLGDNFGAQRIIEVDNESTQKVELDAKDIMLSVDFAALEYGSPESIEYAYRLLGFDERWQYLDAKNRTVTYTNLDPRDYVLEIKSTNRYGVWNDEAIELAIKVNPPWWQTPWAITAFSLLIFFVLFGIFRWRTYALHKRALLLTQSVDEKTIELKQANARLSLLITLDPLTQVFNRRGFTEALAREFSRYQRDNITFSIVLIDIDFFKRINDENGHEAGDKVLVEFTDVIKNQMRSYDIFARWGGEEFIVLLPNTKLQEAIFIANKYRETIAEHTFTINNSSFSVTLTSGVANISQHTDIDACINYADKLLYEGKHMGRNQVLPML